MTAKPFPTVRRVQMYEAVLEELKRRIASGELRPGQQLPNVNDLAEEMGCGRSSVREAIRVLASMGILRVEHGHGTFVTSDPLLGTASSSRMNELVSENIVALSRVRRVLESELAASAANRASDIEIAQITAAAEEMATLVAKGQDFVDPDIRFHMLIAQAAKNPLLERMITSITDLLMESRRMTSAIPGMPQHAAQAHLKIAAAIRSRRPDVARAEMEAHMDEVIETVARRISKNGATKRR